MPNRIYACGLERDTSQHNQSINHRKGEKNTHENDLTKEEIK